MIHDYLLPVPNDVFGRESIVRTSERPPGTVFDIPAPPDVCCPLAVDFGCLTAAKKPACNLSPFVPAYSLSSRMPSLRISSGVPGTAAENTYENYLRIVSRLLRIVSRLRASIEGNKKEEIITVWVLSKYPLPYFGIRGDL